MVDYKELVERLGVLSGMIQMCEPIALGSDSAAMDASADEHERCGKGE